MMLFLRYWKAALIGVLVLAVVGMCHARDTALTAKGVAQERVRRADSTIAVLKIAQAKIDTQFVHDTIRFTAKRDSIKPKIDSVDRWKHDTVQVVKFVAQAEDAINSCTELLGSCKLRVRNLEDQLVQERSKQPALTVVAQRSCTVPALVSGGASALVGFFAGRHGR